MTTFDLLGWATVEEQARPSSKQPVRVLLRTTPKDKAQRDFTDAESHVIVAQLTSNNASDQIELKPSVAQIKHNTGRQANELSADAGYCTAHNPLKLATAQA